MIRADELAAIKAGTVDLAFRRWDRPRVKVGTQLRTSVGLVEVTSVEQVAVSALRAEDAKRSGAASLTALKQAVAAKAERPLFRIGLVHRGADPRDTLRTTLPSATEIADLRVWLDRLDAASPHGPWTHATLRIIDDNPERRAPELAAELGRETAAWKTDVRKLKEKGLTESLAIGYRISPRGAALWDAIRPEGPRTDRPATRAGTALPRTIGAPATRALRTVDVHTLEQVAQWRREDLAGLHGVGPIALDRLAAALADLGLGYRP